jgi:hypothetical protein
VLDRSPDCRSDILAELNITPSGILQHEDILPYPDLILLREKLGFSDAVAYSNAAQLYLRKRLNKIIGSLYDPNNKPNPGRDLRGLGGKQHFVSRTEQV